MNERLEALRNNPILQYVFAVLFKAVAKAGLSLLIKKTIQSGLPATSALVGDKACGVFSAYIADMVVDLVNGNAVNPVAPQRFAQATAEELLQEYIRLSIEQWEKDNSFGITFTNETREFLADTVSNIVVDQVRGTFGWVRDRVQPHQLSHPKGGGLLAGISRAGQRDGLIGNSKLPIIPAGDASLSELGRQRATTHRGNPVLAHTAVARAT